MWWLLLACGGEKWDAVTVEDEGVACLYTDDYDPWSTVGDPPGEESTFTSGDSITVHYVPLDCYSSSCTRNIDISCSVTLEGSDSNQIVIAGTGSWEVASGNQECTADCGLGDSECTIGPLENGLYNVRFVTNNVPLTIPSTATVCLYGADPNL